MIGMAGVVIHAAFVYKLGDWFARDTRDFFELEGIAIPHGTSAYMGPIAVLVDAIIEKIPGVNRIKFSADDIQRKFGPLANRHRGFCDGADYRHPRGLRCQRCIAAGGKNGGSYAADATGD